MKQCEILSDFIYKVTETIDVNNINKIDSKYVHKRNTDYVLLSDIKEVPKEYLNPDADHSASHKYLYTVALPKLDCRFCFDHELDHLPFMMVMEVIRQAGIAIGHTVHGIPLSGFSNIMDNIELHILKFMELDVPLIVIMEDILLKNKSTRQERFMHFYLYQNKRLCGSIDINASVMAKSIYERLRITSRIEVVRNTVLENIPTTNVQMLVKKHEPVQTETLINE